MKDTDITTSASRCIVWDVETAPLPASYLDMIAPEFEAQSNLVDPVKIAASIAKKKAEWMDRAALDPTTGKVLAIGMIDLDGSRIILDGAGDEATLLTEWEKITSRYKAECFVGFSVKSFDCPFLVKRAWKLGVKPFLRPGVNLRYLENWIDLRETWQMGDRQAHGSLDYISKFFGVGSKNGSGADFAALWSSDRPAAEAYLKNDLDLTLAIAMKMGVIV